MICCKCGKSIPDEAVFCSYCGSRNIRKVCKACGTELQKEQVFCHVCGLKWESGTPPEEQKEEKRKKQEEQKEKAPCADALAKGDSLPSKRKSIYYALYTAFGVVYAVLTAVLVLFGVFGYCERYDYLYSRYNRHSFIEEPVFWMNVVSVIAGIVQHVYIFLKVRKGKRATKVNIIVSAALMFVLMFCIFIFLLIFVGNNSIHIRFLI